MNERRRWRKENVLTMKMKIGKKLKATDWRVDANMAYTYSLALAECMYLAGSPDEALREFSDLLERPLFDIQKVLFSLFLLSIFSLFSPF